MSLRLRSDVEPLEVDPRPIGGLSIVGDDDTRVTNTTDDFRRFNSEAKRQKR